MLKRFLPSLLLLSAISTSASAYDAIFAFGDSLSDNGSQHQIYPPAPYDNGRFSNGPVAVEYLANTLGTPLYDFAFAGATTGLYNPDVLGTPFTAYYNTGVLSQVAGYQSAFGVADPNALYFVWAGANDLLNALASSTNPAILQANVNVAISDAVSNLLTEVATLHSMGAQHIFVPNLNDLGSTPQVSAFGAAASGFATFETLVFDNALASALPAYVTQFNTFAAEEQLLVNASSYGFSNVTDACLTTTSLCSNPANYLYWDDLHPTTTADQFLANGFAAALVPEPESYTLMPCGFGLLMGYTRRRQENSRQTAI